jgi:hypothetical protein
MILLTESSLRIRTMVMLAEVGMELQYLSVVLKSNRRFCGKLSGVLRSGRRRCWKRGYICMLVDENVSFWLSMRLQQVERP